MAKYHIELTSDCFEEPYSVVDENGDICYDQDGWLMVYDTEEEAKHQLELLLK